MKEYSYYSNINGKETKKSGTLPDDAPLPDFISKMPTFDNLLENLFSPKLTLKALEALPDYTAPRSNKSHCSETFPPSNGWANKVTKDFYIVVAANGVKPDQYRVDLENDIVTVKFNRPKDDESNRIYDWKGLKSVTDEELKFKFDTRFYDPSTIEAKLEWGNLIIHARPFKDQKASNKRTIAGGLKN